MSWTLLPAAKLWPNYGFAAINVRESDMLTPFPIPISSTKLSIIAASMAVLVY